MKVVDLAGERIDLLVIDSLPRPAAAERIAEQSCPLAEPRDR
jgi:hypothetical protein